MKRKFVFALEKLNTDAMDKLKKLESEGIIKKVYLTKDMKLDERMVNTTIYK